LQEGVVTVDRRLAVQFANGEARRILGIRALEGKPLPDAGALQLRALALRLFDERAAPEQARVALDDGRTFSIAGIPARTGAETAVIVLLDLTDENRRELSEREFVANAAHELRTPLTTIIGAVEVLQAGAKEVPEQRDRFLAHIEREANRLARLARALLVLARAQTRYEEPQRDDVAVGVLLEDVAASLHPRDGVRVVVECERDLTVVTNRDLLEQALRNLAENAAKHTFAGRIVLRGLRARDAVRIDVEDTGGGIAPEAQRFVFGRFSRGEDRQGDGFGLGLAIVREAVQALEGRVELDSAPGAGTRFSILLPLRAERAAA
jgi:signal transduction histidine kinase